jgi:hypothetical protein
MESNTQTQVLYLVGNACLTIDVLASQLDLPRYKVAKAVARLSQRNLLARVEEGCFSATEAGLAMIANGDAVSNGAPSTAVAARKPFRGTLRQRAWNVMRIQPSFTIRHIAMVASAGTGNPEKNLQKWFLGLERAGYLSRLGQRQPGDRPGSNGCVRYRLARDTGPHAPVLSDVHGLIRDPNSGKDFPCNRI